MNDRNGSTYKAYQVLHFGFTVAPILAGLDKFTNILVNWSVYLAPSVAKMLPLSAGAFMRVVGIIEIIAGIIVAAKPRAGGIIVFAWLIAIVLNLLLAHGFYDIALRDFGLSLGALALFFLSQTFSTEGKY
jgi:hypothetical protein